MTGDTICADMTITGSHDNVVVPSGTVCISSGAYIAGNVKVYGAFEAHRDTTIEGNLHGGAGTSLEVGLVTVESSNAKVAALAMKWDWSTGGGDKFTVTPILQTN
jgi:hypothetical protein